MCEHTHSNEGYKEKICAHGNCYQHAPKWKELSSKMVPRNNFFDRLGSIFRKKCCGERMSVAFPNTKNQCTLCGREDTKIGYAHLFCLCCGKREVIYTPD